MRVRLKGVNRVAKRLADGSRVVYYYAWKGGPRLPKTPGDPEFISAYKEAYQQKVTASPNVLQSILDAYQNSPNFNDLAHRTQRDYVRQIRRIEEDFGDFPLSALTDAHARTVFLEWRDNLALKSRRQADYAFSVLALILSWALDRGHILKNPCERPKKLYRSGRVEITWTEADVSAFLIAAPERLRLAFLLALWTGQRQADLLGLKWSAYDGEAIRLKQNKGGRRLVIPVGAFLKEALDAAGKNKSSSTILTTLRGTPWTSDGFRTAWHKAKKVAKIEGLTFHDLRGTAVTRLALAGCSIPEIATITGHSLRQVGDILDAHYLSRDRDLAESAMRKLESYSEKGKNPQLDAQLPRDARL